MFDKVKRYIKIMQLKVTQNGFVCLLVESKNGKVIVISKNKSMQPLIINPKIHFAKTLLSKIS
jgi:hypothetical protein